MDWAIVAVAVLLAVIVFFNVVATVSLKRSAVLEPFQKWAQGVIVWLIPLLGAFLVVHVVAEHEPDVVPRKTLAWSGVGWCLLFAAGRELGSEGSSLSDGGAGLGELGGGDGGGGGAGGQ